MPLIITEEMVKNDPFFKKGKEETEKEYIKKLYKKLNLSPQKIAETLDLPLEFVEKVIKETNSKKE